MRRPRAFTCSRLKAEPLPPPTRKPLGYAESWATSIQSSCSPCKCGTCGESPASPASSSTDTSAKVSNSVGGWPDSIAPNRTEALGSSGSNGSPLAGKPRYRRLARNAAPRRIVFNTPPPSSATAGAAASAAAAAAAESAVAAEETEGIEPSEQRNKRGSDRGM
ncbi:unnamed protein product, partial [Hapterophycus canaliculatus]